MGGGGGRRGNSWGEWDASWSYCQHCPSKIAILRLKQVLSFYLVFTRQLPRKLRLILAGDKILSYYLFQDGTPLFPLSYHKLVTQEQIQVHTNTNEQLVILLCSCPIVAYKAILVLYNFVPRVLFFFNCINVVKEKESGRLKVAIILKLSVAKFKSKIRRCSNLTFRSLKVSFTFSIFGPFPSSRNSTYQNETKCKSFL